MAAKRGLNMGRGLESLFSKGPGPDAESRQEAQEKTPATRKGNSAEKASEKNLSEKPESNENSVTSTDGIRQIPIEKISPNASQPRKAFDEEAIAELAASIKEYGVVQPLLVQRKGEAYEIIAGERRWRAAKQAGLHRIPVLVRDYADRETFEISLIENLQRENLNAIEEAQAYQRLVNEYQLTQEEVATRVSKSRTAVTNALRLLKLEEEVQQLLVAGDLSMGHARALLGLPTGEMQKLAAKKVRASGLSVRDTERLVKRLMKPAAPREKQRANEQLDVAYKSIEDRLRKMTGTKVNIHRGRGATGRIEIEYYSQEDLERIISLIG